MCPIDVLFIGDEVICTLDIFSWTFFLKKEKNKFIRMLAFMTNLKAYMIDDG